ncbi:WD40 repeat-like protein, partial [Ceratobasidium sp. AG-I]
GALVAGPFEGHTSSVSCVGFSPDGTRIVSGSWDNTIRVWDARSGMLVASPFEGHTSEVSFVAFSIDRTRIVSSSNDHSLRVWDVAPLPPDDFRVFTDWVMDENGMVITHQRQLLLCVPLDLRARLMWPRNTLCICWKGAFKLDFDGVLLGSNWVGCCQGH